MMPKIKNSQQYLSLILLIAAIVFGIIGCIAIIMSWIIYRVSISEKNLDSISLDISILIADIAIVLCLSSSISYIIRKKLAKSKKAEK